jgi:hypothetical protein
MSSRVKLFVKNFGVFIAAALAVLGWAATSGWTTVDRRYVHADEFALLQAGEARQRMIDSVMLASDLRDVRRMLSGLDSSDRCRRHQSEFCR